MLSELKILFTGIAKWLAAAIALAGFFFVSGVKTFGVYGGLKIAVPWLGGKTFAVRFFDMMRNDLVPEGVELIVTNPFNAFLIQIKISVFLAFIILFPFLLRSVLKYLSPALKPNERSTIYKVIIPSTALFLGGCVFAYSLVIPATIRILYSYVPSIEAMPFFDVGDFVSLAFTFMLAIGAMFLLPILMALSSRLGIIEYNFWRKHWREIVFAFVIFSAVVTPDGSGITMALLVVPLLVLYALGLALSRRASGV